VIRTRQTIHNRRTGQNHAISADRRRHGCRSPLDRDRQPADRHGRADTHSPRAEGRVRGTGRQSCLSSSVPTRASLRVTRSPCQQGLSLLPLRRPRGRDSDLRVAPSAAHCRALPGTVSARRPDVSSTIAGCSRQSLASADTHPES
jgi:hypothetical protein